ncbi:phage tail sheath C-terminal domain-containing protein [Clostridium sp.]|uniref:phage tail sheath C-terminal domain-containing protein n=1 Tax=Clostridium sp. TaxID=1506 RepID=UPI0039923471
MLSLPIIDIKFKQLANTLVKRSERAIACLIINDEKQTEKLIKYKSLKELDKDKSKYTDENLQDIKDCMEYGVAEMYVVNADTVEASLDLIEENIKTCWIASNVDNSSSEIINFIKEHEVKGKSYKAVVYKGQNIDNKHVVNFVNEKVIFNDKRGETTGDNYIPSLLGLLASSNVERGVTYRTCNKLIRCAEIADVDAELKKGNFVLINDDNKVKVGLGINTLVTFNESNSEDMRHIDIVEAMDLIRDDITNIFKEEYIGKVKNKLDNQILFISSINTYLDVLAKQDILDSDYKNYADINVTAQRQAWLGVKPESESWSDEEVKVKTFKRNVYLQGDIKILGAMENLMFDITMF